MELMTTILMQKYQQTLHDPIMADFSMYFGALKSFHGESLKSLYEEARVL